MRFSWQAKVELWRRGPLKAGVAESKQKAENGDAVKEDNEDRYAGIRRAENRPGHGKRFAFIRGTPINAGMPVHGPHIMKEKIPITNAAMAAPPGEGDGGRTAGEGKGGGAKGPPL